MHETANDQIRVRTEKLSRLKSRGIEAYPPKYCVTHTSADLLSQKDSLMPSGAHISYAGRVRRINRKGKLTFIDVHDGNARIQAVLSPTVMGEEEYEVLRLIDLGDWIGLNGTMFNTHTGEYSIKVELMTVLSKSLRPLPIPKEAHSTDGERICFDEFRDPEARYRQRHIDLALNDQARTTFVKRSAIIRAMREYLHSQNYLEVETPILQPVYGGAHARPFTTRHHTHGSDVFLRISNELYLKRCIIGGFERVFEFARDFRNEGTDRTHNPEFTLLEFYEAYADYFDMMDRVEELILSSAAASSTSLQFPWNGASVDLSCPWQRVSLMDSLHHHFDADFQYLCREEIADEYGDFLGLDYRDQSKGEMLITLFERNVAPTLIQPHFIYDFPAESSPLCRQHREKAGFIEQFELYMGGVEMCNAYSEQTNPILQKEAFLSQSEELRNNGEYHPVDTDFVTALESGMPPTGGVGIGIDRLVMLLTGKTHIKDVILFPLMKAHTDGR